jgi:hypothetical protein
MKLVIYAAASCALVAAGCSGSGARDEERPPRARAVAAAARAAAELPRLTRQLIPVVTSPMAVGRLQVVECGIAPTSPCVATAFTYRSDGGVATRMASLRELAERRGWRVVRTSRTASGGQLELARPPFHARYAIARGLLAGSGEFVDLRVIGPPTTLPSTANTTAWSEAKRRYVVAANAVCMRTLSGHARKPARLAAALAKTAAGLTALTPPPGDEPAVTTFLRPLRRLAVAVKALNAARDEEALPAAVAVGEYTKQFNEAASRYGLARCVAP